MPNWIRNRLVIATVDATSQSFPKIGNLIAHKIGKLQQMCMLVKGKDFH
jgi:hypothetical protein